VLGNISLSVRHVRGFEDTREDQDFADDESNGRIHCLVKIKQDKAAANAAGRAGDEEIYTE
jgi:hypothetical protein